MSPKDKLDKSAHSGKELRSSLLVTRIVESYESQKRITHFNTTFLPNRVRTIHVIELLRQLFFPGLFEDQKLKPETIHYHVGDLVEKIREGLYEQVRQSLRYRESQQRSQGKGDEGEACDQEADRITQEFLERIPELRRLLALDVKAGFDGDPAAESTDEIIFCYPGLDAIFIHRVAHEFYKLKVPLLPRIMSEYAHNETGIDIHPGATIGESFFIDHGTGVVIGETTHIGNRVKIYQSVTLGALSTKGGQSWRGRKRHPTIEDDVTIYANATILGGETIIGAGATINGGVFVTRSVPAGHTVAMEPPVLKVSQKPGKTRKNDAETDSDFQL